MNLVMQTNLEGVKLLRRGKVRDIYEIEDKLLIVATDRISAFDVVLPTGIPNKGKVLTQISLYWFNVMNDVVKNHIITADVNQYPDILKPHADTLKDRSMLVQKTKVLPIEAIVRGYLSGSGWKEYKKSGTVCGIRLPAGLLESSKLQEPIFTPSTKADEGHDINITFDETVKIIGEDMANKVKDIALTVYKKARDIAEKKGIIIADTKMEFGITQNGELILIDELLTPDSSRFWSAKDYTVGKGQDSYDKQIVRDYLLTLDWNQTYPGPSLPEDIVNKAQERYEEILRILTA
ncbi:MAG: phosphoribosylaminoimidazolesuccinocarboxamide synthase [Thermodesulfovibrionales bacterium]|nr:phosphoribosylaminoimidazolesuccinocarboxamide synthase [Thermodesulfovibrionales bacterium]